MDPLKEDSPINVELTHEQLGALAFLVNSQAYVEVYRPFLIGMLRGFHADLADPSQQRRWNKPDDYLRGGILVVQALLNFPEQTLDEARQAEEATNRERSVEQQYQDRVDAGHIGPMGVSDEEF